MIWNKLVRASTVNNSLNLMIVTWNEKFNTCTYKWNFMYYIQRNPLYSIFHYDFFLNQTMYISFISNVNKLWILLDSLDNIILDYIGRTQYTTISIEIQLCIHVLHVYNWELIPLTVPTCKLNPNYNCRCITVGVDLWTMETFHTVIIQYPNNLLMNCKKGV